MTSRSNQASIESNILNITKRMRTEFINENGFMDRYTFRWLQNILRNEFKSTIEFVDSGYDLSSYGNRTREKYTLSDYETIGDFLNEPTGYTQATYISGSGLAAETWEERINGLFIDALTEWLKESGLYESILEPEEGLEMIDDSFWDIYITERVSEYDWSERFYKIPMDALKIKALK